MISILKDIFNWLKNPDEERLDISTQEKVTILVKLLLWDFGVGFLFSGIIYLINRYVIQFESSLIHMDMYSLIGFAIFLVPFFEEVIFRLPLKYQRNYLARGIDFISNDWLKNNWDKFRKYFFYVLIFAFGYVHITNFDNLTPLHYALGIFMIGSQLFGGITISYTRLKIGFFWGYLQHLLFNGILICFGLMFEHQQPIIEIQNDQMELRIDELMYTEEDDSYSKLTTDDSGHILTIDGNDIALETLLERLKIEDVKPLENRWIDIKFDCPQGMSKDKFVELLKTEIEMK